MNLSIGTQDLSRVEKEHRHMRRPSASIHPVLHEQRRVQWGDRVHVDFMVWRQDGTLVDSSLFRGPLVFVAGREAVMPMMTALVMGMTVGESRTERISPEQTISLLRPEYACQGTHTGLQARAVVSMAGLRQDLPENDEARIRTISAERDGDRITLDAGHPPAGENILIQLDLLAIMDETEPIVLHLEFRG